MSQMKRLYESIEPCPICNNTPTPEHDYGWGTYSIACRECHDPTPMDPGEDLIPPPHFGAGATLSDAITKWNYCVETDIEDWRDGHE